MIIGKDKDKVAELVAKCEAYKRSHDALMIAVKKEAVDAKAYLETHGKSQKRKLDSMILFCGNLITICERSGKAVKNVDGTE